MKRIFFVAALFVLLIPYSVFAQRRSASDWQLLASNYLVDVGQVAIGKIVHGENVFRALTVAFRDAAPAALIHHQSMKMVGRNWENAFVAQLLHQKGSQIVRRSILNRPLLSTELLTENEFDYLAMNIRFRKLSPEFRVNLMTATVAAVGVPVGMLLDNGVYRFDVRHSLTTGILFYEGGTKQDDSLRSLSKSNMVLVSDASVTAHEISHVFQYSRHNALWDVLYRQDFSQERKAKLFRFEGGFLTFLPFYLVEKEHGKRWPEWEARGYAALSPD